MPLPIFPWQSTWHINVWRMGGETCPRRYFCGSLWLLGTIFRQIQAPRSVSRERAESCLSIVRRSNAEQRYHQWGQLTHFHCTIARMDLPHLSGSHMSYVTLVDVREIWQCTTTPNPHVHKVSRSSSVSFLIYEPKSASFYTCHTVVLYTRLIWAGLPMLLHAH